MSIIKAKIYEVVPFETKPDILDNWYVIYYGSDIPVTAWYDSESGWQLDHDEKRIPTHWLKPLFSEKTYTEEELKAEYKRGYKDGVSDAYAGNTF